MHAQDIQYSRLDMVPLYLNAAHTGNYLGSLRIGGIHRQQWNTNTINGFQSPLFFVDAPIIRGFSELDWFGLGAIVFNDQAGAIQLSQSGFFASMAYHKALSEDRSSVLSLGYQIGFADRQIKAPSSAIFLDELEQFGIISEDRSLLNLEKQTFIDMNLGIRFKSRWTEYIHGTIGLHLRHINRPNQSLFRNGQEAAQILYIFDIQAQIELSPIIRISPKIYHLRNKTSQATTLLTDLSYLLQGKQELNLIASLGSRWGDSFLVGFGGAWNRFKLMMNFDVIYSQINNISGANAVELTANYIFSLKRNKKNKPVIFCPRF